ncbi:uncharacterized protein LOC125836056 [Solanum verrucosum]|uniref:uncharacterized protein LOC125836056 n=1 Tax=Solanum verrucosum TaxID=315347 RepID=UPI0020D057EB|nr:uncharacterized protein LOC125836056 [Solanum verrucosum]
MGNVNKNLLAGILYGSSAAIIWKDLEERFDKVNDSRSYYLHREIAILTQGISTISVYFSKLKDLWDEYNTLVPPPCDCERSRDFIAHFEKQRLFQVLMGLDDSHYDQILARPVLTLEQHNKVLAMLNNTSVNEGSAHMAANCFFEPVNKQDDHEWNIVDTGATNHMIGDKNLLKSDTLIESAERDLCTGKVKEIGRELEGLYVINMKQKEDSQRKGCSSARNMASEDLWHQRMGHVPIPVLKRVYALPFHSSSTLNNCDVCPRARQRRLPFPISHSKIRSDLDGRLAVTMKRNRH